MLESGDLIGMSRGFGMTLTPGESNSTKNFKYTDALYASVVRSLYADSQSLFVGVLSVIIAPLVIYWKEGDHFQLLFSALFLLSGTARILLAQAFLSGVKLESARQEYEKWDNRYYISGCLFVFLLGSWFLSTVLITSDTFSQMLALSLSLCYMVGTIGRNFASDKIVSSHALIISTLIIAGLVSSGGPYNIILSIFLIPFFIAIRLMSTRLREIFFFSERASEANKKIAERFNIALDNVMHGIAMFDASGKIVVANDRFVELAGFDSWDVHGNTLATLARQDNHNRRQSASSELALRMLNYLRHSKSSCFNFQTPENKVIEVDFNSMEAGGVVVLADITDRVQSEKIIRNLANFDPLTDLPNRRFFVEEIQRHLSKNGEIAPCSMFFVDLDNFKEVNDTLGHAAGDKLLTTVSQRLLALMRSNDMICRFGGDEFVIVSPNLTDIAECSAFAQRIIDEILSPIDVDGNTLYVGASIGIAIGPESGKNVDELLQNTDVALYDAKGSGRNRFVFYSDELGEAISYRRALEVDLEAAIKNSNIDVYFQPLINLKRGKITTCEALVRWDHPEFGRISPDVFVKIAEETGLINSLGTYVLSKAIDACKEWPEHVRVAVNVSSLQFKTSDVVATVRELLVEKKFASNRLEIEVTETVMLENTEEVDASLRSLSEMGVRLSLDDFGTGFSSLSYLHSLPFDKVKIDRSFIENGIANERSLTLLKGVVDLIKRLGLSVVLEGIENEKQMQLLSRSVDVNEVQGFLFARPLPQHDIEALLRAAVGKPDSDAKDAVA